MTHNFKDRKWRDIRSYQVEDDVHGRKAHARSLNRKQSCCFYCCLVFWDKTTKERNKVLTNCSSLWTLLPNKSSPNSNSTVRKIQWGRDFKGCCRLNMNFQNPKISQDDTLNNWQLPSLHGVVALLSPWHHNKQSQKLRSSCVWASTSRTSTDSTH